jgi:hypothetical protein
LLIIFTLLGIGAVTCLAQASLEEFRSALSAKGGFTSDDLSAVERGEIVIKLLPVVDKREVAVCGVARLRGTPEVIVKAFKESMAQQNIKSILAIGRFSNPPNFAASRRLHPTERNYPFMYGVCQKKVNHAYARTDE